MNIFFVVDICDFFVIINFMKSRMTFAHTNYYYSKYGIMKKSTEKFM